MQGPCSSFVSLHLSLDCQDLDVRLFIEVVDGIRRKQLDLLLENTVVKKPLEERWDEEATLKSVVFFFDSLSSTVFITECSYSAVTDMIQM